MTSSGEYRGPQGEDVVFERVDSGAGFARSTSKPILYLPVIAAGTVLGFLWWSDDADAAGFAIRTAAGGVANNAAVAWNKALDRMRTTGVGAADAVTSLSRGPGFAEFGILAAVAPTSAESSISLKRHAATAP